MRFHLGTAEIMGTVSLLDCDTIEPGGWGLAQVFLEEPATATWGQPFVVRESSATQTLGGGQVLQPVATQDPPPAPGDAGAHRTALDAATPSSGP